MLEKLIDIQEVSDDSKNIYFNYFLDFKKTPTITSTELEHKVYKKEIILTKNINEYNLEKEVVRKIKEIAKSNEIDENFNKELDIMSVNEQILLQQIFRSIQIIGIKNHILSRNFKLLHNNKLISNYKQEIKKNLTCEVIRSQYLNHEDIIIYDKNKEYESGIRLIKNNHKFEIIQFGFSFEKKFVYFKIIDIIEDRKRKLKKININV